MSPYHELFQNNRYSQSYNVFIFTIMDNYNKTVNAIVASEEAEKLRYLNNYDQTDAPLIIESLSRKKTTDFRFHIILNIKGDAYGNN